MEWYLKVIKNYANFKGRARRKEYWMFVLWNVLIFAGLGITTGILGAMIGDAAYAGIGIMVFYAFAMFIPALAVTVRRLHDTGRSGWWYLINFLPFGGILLLVFLAEDSDPGENRFGPNPKRPYKDTFDGIDRYYREEPIQVEKNDEGETVTRIPYEDF